MSEDLVPVPAEGAARPSREHHEGNQPPTRTTARDAFRAASGESWWVCLSVCAVSGELVSLSVSTVYLSVCLSVCAVSGELVSLSVSKSTVCAVSGELVSLSVSNYCLSVCQSVQLVESWWVCCTHTHTRTHTHPDLTIRAMKQKIVINSEKEDIQYWFPFLFFNCTRVPTDQGNQGKFWRLFPVREIRGKQGVVSQNRVKTFKSGNFFPNHFQTF